MLDRYERILERSRERAALIKRQMKYLGRFDIKNFDHIVRDYQDEAFEEVDCLQCGNCCRKVGPRFGESDVKRLARVVGFDRAAFVRDVLVRDEDPGWRLRTLPCPYVGEDNRCSVYEDRPRDCESYPYLAERGIQRSLGRLAFNTGFCPAACLVAERIMERFADGQTK